MLDAHADLPKRWPHATLAMTSARAAMAPTNAFFSLKRGVHHTISDSSMCGFVT
jgi:hypothetical protein